ncbi:Hypothetical predicted protein [Paramuricea clavata]|nr:Hypothetical predicted protein [Paramuricea clavata]
MRNRCMQEAYLKKHGLNKNLQPNLTSTKAHLHSRKSSRSPRKKVKKKTSRLKVTEENISRAKESHKATISRNKTKQNQSNENLIPHSHRTVKNQDKNNSNELNCTTSVIICSVRKLISSYSTKNISTSSQTLWKKPKVSQRPKTSCGKKAAVHCKSEIKIKRQSCPPPLFQPSESLPLISRNMKLKKVYYSEAQSHMLAGVPCVPPASPLNNDCVAVETVPCLADIKSQQLIKSKLRCLLTQRQRADEKNREKILKEEKRKEREQQEGLKQQRRAEIYALNEVMKEHERNKFLQFMKEKHNGATKISLNV